MGLKLTLKLSLVFLVLTLVSHYSIKSNLVTVIFILAVAFFISNYFVQNHVIVQKVKCKVCYYDFKVKSGKAQAECKYCNTKYILRANGEMIQLNNNIGDKVKENNNNNNSKTKNKPKQGESSVS